MIFILQTHGGCREGTEYCFSCIRCRDAVLKRLPTSTFYEVAGAVVQSCGAGACWLNFVWLLFLSCIRLGFGSVDVLDTCFGPCVVALITFGAAYFTRHLTECNQTATKQWPLACWFAAAVLVFFWAHVGDHVLTAWSYVFLACHFLMAALYHMDRLPCCTDSNRWFVRSLRRLRDGRRQH